MITLSRAKLFLLCFAALAFSARETCVAQSGEANRKREEVRIWPGTAPGSEGAAQVESSMPFTLKPQDRIVRNVTVPTLTIFRPSKQTGNKTAIILAPGGGFSFLSFDDEGTQEAEHFASLGITTFVLKYRVTQTPARDEDFIPAPAGPPPNTPEARLAIWKRATAQWPKKTPEERERITAMAVADGVQAVKYIREHAPQFQISPDKILFGGFSAGAAVSAGVLLQADASLRPNYALMVYGAPLTPTVPALPLGLPPMFLAYAADDPLVGAYVERFRVALHAANIHPEIHEFNAGDHGFGMSQLGTTSDHWLQELDWWMEEQRLLPLR